MAGDKKLVALFIDAENLIRPLEQRLERFLLEPILRRSREYGSLIFSRAYADWGYFPCKEYIRDFSKAGVEMSQLHSDFKGKNTADVQLAVDVMEHCTGRHSADSIVVVSGDRDFVPLVQSLRRMGKEVICICVDDASNQTLEQICDVYIAYETLSGTARPPVEPVTSEAAPTEEKVEAPDPMKQALTTLVDAVVAIKRRSQPQGGGNVNSVMRQLQPSFDFLALGFDSFKEFCEEAARRGAIKMSMPTSGIGDFILDYGTSSSEPGIRPISIQQVSHFNYDSPEGAIDSYRKLLQRKRVPLLPWRYRKPLVEHLWEFLSQRGEVGAYGSELVREVISFAWEQEWNVSEEQGFKMIYTMNLGFCFKIAGVAQKTTDIMNNFLTPAVDVDQAFDLMHFVYLSGLKMEDRNIRFRPDAVAELLFDEVNPDNTKAAQNLIFDMIEWQRGR